MIEYCQTHQELLQQEAKQGRKQLEKEGVPIEPKITHLKLLMLLYLRKNAIIGVIC